MGRCWPTTCSGGSRSRAPIGRSNGSSGARCVLDILSHADRYFGRLQYEIDHLLEDGEMVAVHATASGETLIGRSYANEYMFLLRLRDGVIVEGWEFLDTAYAYSRNHPE